MGNPNGEAISIREAVKMPHESTSFVGERPSEAQLLPVIAAWNAREWAEASELLAALHTDFESQSIAVVLNHLRAIAENFLGRYKTARDIFEKTLAARMNNDTEILGVVERATANWLACTCLLQKRWEDAAVSWAVACSNTTMDKSGSAAGHETQAFVALSLMENGSYTGKDHHLTNLAEALVNNLKTNTSILPHLSSKRKAQYLAACLPYLEEKPETKIPIFSDRPDDITISTSTFSDPFQALRVSSNGGASSATDDPSVSHAPLLHHDPFLLLSTRKFAYIAEFGLPMTEQFLGQRFLGKVHFPQINLTALHTTTRGLPFLVNALEKGLAVRGMLTGHYWDRIRAVRIRNFGAGMDFVASFVIVFHKWPVGINKIGVQIPAHLIRDKWSEIRKPGMHVYPKLYSEVKKILRDAEEEEDDVTPLRSGRLGGGLRHGGDGQRDVSVADSKRSLLGGGRSWFGSVGASRRQSMQSQDTQQQPAVLEIEDE